MVVLTHRLGSSVRSFAGARHLDPTVTTGISRELYVSVRNVSLAGRMLLQLGHWRDALSAETAVLDLNPRSVTAWLLLLSRKALRRRTLLWGHLNPRGGAESKTVGFRDFMRGLANGTVLYGYDSVVRARQSQPQVPLWVAPNSLYREVDMHAAIAEGPSLRLLYVGRLVESKKVDLILRALATPLLTTRQVSVDIVGDGDQLAHLTFLAQQLGISDRVRFLGHQTDVSKLRSLYATAACALSPGYAGLNLTQSLGFGVPVVVADNEPHAPEIELVKFGGVSFFRADDALDMAEVVARVIDQQRLQNRSELAERVRSSYSAEAMADGLMKALVNEPQALTADGWPRL